MIRRNTYVISGEKEWSQFYWNAKLSNAMHTKDKNHYHHMLVYICLNVLNGRQTFTTGLNRQYGYTAAMKQAQDIYNAIHVRCNTWSQM